MKPAVRPSAKVRRMHNTPMGPSGAAMEKPISNPRRKRMGFIGVERWTEKVRRIGRPKRINLRVRLNIPIKHAVVFVRFSTYVFQVFTHLHGSFSDLGQISMGKSIVTDCFLHL